MGRQQSVYPAQVLDVFENHGNLVTVSTIAKEIGCSSATVRNKVKKLRDEGRPILPTKDGLLLVDIVNEENAGHIRQSGTWIIGEIVGLSRIGSITKKPLLQVRKLLELTREERKELKDVLIKITYLITAAELDEDSK